MWLSSKSEERAVGSAVVVLVERRAVKEGTVLLCVMGGLALPASRESNLRWKSSVFVRRLVFGEGAGPTLCCLVGTELEVVGGAGPTLCTGEVVRSVEVGVRMEVVGLLGVSVEGFGSVAGPTLCGLVGEGVGREKVVELLGVGVEGFGDVTGPTFCLVGTEEVVGVGAGSGTEFGVGLGEGGACVGMVGVRTGIGVGPVGVAVNAAVKREEVLKTALLVTRLLPIPS